MTRSLVPLTLASFVLIATLLSGPILAQDEPKSNAQTDPKDGTTAKGGSANDEAGDSTAKDAKGKDGKGRAGADSKLSDTPEAREKREAELLKRFPNFLGELKRSDGFDKLTADGAIWIHKDKKAVVVSGHICLRRGPLEMFACPSRTKEHESVIAAGAKSRFVHAALLAVGAKSGKPVQWQPEYAPASGTVIDVYVMWKDEAGKKHAARAQDWIRDWKTKKAMADAWVFAGSEFWNDPATGDRHYSADSGEMICLSNFSTAMLDIPIESSQSDGALLFEAFSERIPPLRTQVRLLFVPRMPPKKGKPARSGVEAPKEATSAADSSSSDGTKDDQ